MKFIITSYVLEPKTGSYNISFDVIGADLKSVDNSAIWIGEDATSKEIIENIKKSIQEKEETKIVSADQRLASLVGVEFTI